MKCAVIYYSKAGTTKKIAEKIRERFNADLYFVEPREAYGNYVSAVIRVGREKRRKEDVQLKSRPANFAKYDVVFVGFPVWYGSLPEFMKTYLKQCNLKGKRVIPFATAGANSRDAALEAVRQLLPGSNVTDYFYTSMVKRADADQWLEGIKL